MSHLRPDPSSWRRGQSAETGAAESSDRGEMPSFMSALDSDVHLEVMTFLSANDLSSILRTCRYIFNIGIPSLCLHAGKKPIETVHHLLSFRDFLRVGSLGSRDTHIQRLWFRLHKGSHSDARASVPQRAEDWKAVLTILFNCRGLRSLRIDTWDDCIDPVTVLNTITTSLKSLDDLSIALTPDLAEDAHRLSLIPLRRLTFQWPQNSRAPLEVRRSVLWTITPLAKTLVELNNVVPRSDVRTPFLQVRQLGLAMDRSKTLIRDAIRTFPNVTRLSLHSEHHRRCHWDVQGPGEDKAARAHNQSCWSMDYPHAWPSLTAIWAEDLCGAYCFGCVRSIRAISLPLSLDPRFYMLPAIVADMQPRFLELRVDLDDPRICTGILDRLRMPDWRWLKDQANASLSHLTLLLCGLDRVPVYASYQTEAKLILKGFASALRNASVTHLLLKYPGHQHADIVDAIVADALPCATRLAKGSPSLCWVGIDIDAAGLLCWDVRRSRAAGPSDQDRTTETTLIRMSEDAGVKLLVTEGMDDFKYVRM